LTRHYLDTTAQIERWTGDQPTQDAFKARLAGDTHSTSSHVRREWQNIIDQSCVDALNAIESGANDLGSFYARLSQGGWGRKAGQRLRALSLLVAGEAAFDAGEVQTRALALLRYQSRALFGVGIDEVRDGSECGLARKVVARRKGKRVLINAENESDRCKKTDVICRQDADLEGKLVGLRAAAAALRGSSNAGHKTMGRCAEKAAASAPERKGKNCYGYLGDVSIALECRTDEVLLTTDRSFEVIAPVLAINVVRLPATPGP
jgi:hypothetical protein